MAVTTELLINEGSTLVLVQASLAEHRVIESKPDSAVDDLRCGLGLCLLRWQQLRGKKGGFAVNAQAQYVAADDATLFEVSALS